MSPAPFLLDGVNGTKGGHLPAPAGPHELYRPDPGRPGEQSTLSPNPGIFHFKRVNAATGVYLLGPRPVAAVAARSPA